MEQENIKENTENFLRSLELQAKNITAKQQKNSIKDFSITYGYTENALKFVVGSAKVKRITLNKESNTLNISVYNTEMLKVIGSILLIDFIAVKEKVRVDFKKLICYNDFVRTAIKDNTTEIYKQL